MKFLLEKSNRLISKVSLQYRRDQAQSIPWDWRLISLIGARGVGKTTLLLQQAKLTFGVGSSAIYISMDDIYFTTNRLVDFADIFFKQGGKQLYLDEVHKYPGWAREIKNIYDFYPDLKIVFTGSSIIELLKQDVDLSRRALSHELHGLSFREYLKLNESFSFPILKLSQILKEHQLLSSDITQEIRPLKYFSNYLKEGYYPYFLEGSDFYHERLARAIRVVIESDLSFIPGYDPRNARKIYQLFYILSANVPFKPNISKLSDKIGIHRNTLIQYLHHLEKARLIHALYPAGISVSVLQKPEKIFLHNPNLAFAISPHKVDKGSLRETFFLNQLRPGHDVFMPKKGDFIVDEEFLFEVGGLNKGKYQIKGIPNSFRAVDDIEIGVRDKIPLWLFGFLY